MKEEDVVVPKWAEAEAAITIRQIKWLSLFKREYVFVMLFRGDFWRASTEEEKETGIYPGRSVLQAVDLDEMFPIFDGKPKKKKEPHVTPEMVKDRKLYMGAYKVSRTVYRKFKKAKRVHIRFELANHMNVEFLEILESL